MKVFVGFGCPRSGTTFLYHCLRALEPCALVVKLVENHALHPAKCRDGLFQLGVLFKAHDLTLVRSVRYPMDIVESFLAARTDALREKTSSIARNSDSSIVRWIREESESVMAQRPSLAEMGHVRFLEMRDTAMRCQEGRKAFWKELAVGIGDTQATSELMARLDTYGKKPVRSGRLSEGLGRVSTDEELADFTSQLTKVIAREGYHG